MARQAQPAYRRLAEAERQQLLVDATIDVLAEYGLSGTTVRRIAAQAGVTPGLVTHHFAGKDALVSAAYRSLADRLHADYVAATEAAGSDAVARLEAYVGSAFEPATLDRNLLRVWTSFWTSALTDPASEPAKVHYETAARSRDYLEGLLADALAATGRPADAKSIGELAITVISLSDGLWLTWGLDPGLFDAGTGRHIVFEMLADRLSIPELAGSA